MQMSQGQMIKLRYTSVPIVHNLPSIVLGFAKSHPYSHWRETILMYKDECGRCFAKSCRRNVHMFTQ